MGIKKIAGKLKVMVLLLGIAVAIASCVENDLLPVSVDLIDDITPDFIIIDTLTLDVSTVRLDSFVTSDTERLLVGRHEDEYIGEITSTSFFEVAYQDYSFYPPDASRFDSLTLVLYYDYNYFDTLQTQTIDIYRLAENIEYNAYGTVYNTADFTLEKAPLTSHSFKPRPNTTDSLEIRLPDKLGKELLQKGLTSAGELFSLVLFTDFLKGFALVPGAGSEGFLGFTKANSSLKLYYSDYTNIPPTQLTYKFPVSQGTVCFNRTTFNPKSTTLRGLESQLDEVSSGLTSNYSFIQAGAYIMTKVEIPYIQELLILPGSVYIPHADLVIRPVAGTYRSGTNTNLPTSITGYYGSIDNYPLGAFNTSSEFVLDDEFGKDTYYRLEVTDLVNNLLDTDQSNDYSILLGLDENAMLFGAGRVYLKDGAWQDGMKLQVYYIPLDTDEN
ncbi:DUF4270 family protein [Imperialibacter roseus]|uniref:DUF4270 family protein n=1 Tax=Imperialibacter roseus TaxID=1324217 RepID=A0ABZ0IQ92_9BACT|nr:DUF4270 family protein [Imperialibacter roseus]WOK07170.1 DUF4270 family protein [Imperialibacter roseus]